ncbi:MAG: hypothetical protein O7C39_02415, partial [Bacteroidetes bacterium]|nr:hypothetical protein [Bacteroidota bacterium]
MRTWLTYSKPRYLAYVLGIPLTVFLLSTAFIVSSPEITSNHRGVDASQFEYKTHPALGATGVRAEKRGNPSINLTDGRLFEESYRGSFDAVYGLSSGAARPLSLTRSDFDENAMPDVVAGYATASGGLLTLRRGNADIISSMSIEALDRLRKGETTQNPFLDEIRVWTIPIEPAFLASGDFNDDGHIDLVAASEAGREMYWFFGTGNGSFAEPSRVEIDGNITVLKAGEFGRKNGLAELLVGITRDSGSAIKIFQGPDGAFQALPRLVELPFPVIDFALGDLTGDDLSDLVVISKSSLQIVEASEPGQIPVPVRSYELPFEPSAVEIGNFAAGLSGEINNSPQSQIALVSDTGDLHLWVDGELSTVVTHLPKAIPGRIRLVRSRVANTFRDGLAILDGGTNQVHIVTQDHFEVAFEVDETPKLTSIPEEAERHFLPSPLLLPVTLPSTGRPVAIISTRYNQDALDDLILLSESTNRLSGATHTSAGNDLSVALTTPLADFVVNNAGNENDGDTDDAFCDTGNATDGFTGICTLKAAIMQANKGAQTGITFAVPAVTIPNTSGFTRIFRSVVIDGRIGTTNRVMLTTDWVGNIPGTSAMFHFDGAASGNSTVINTEVFGLTSPPAIFFEGSSNNVVQGNYFHDLGGSAIRAWADNGGGTGSTSLQIGGLTDVPGTGVGNVLSGNRDGIKFGTNLDTPGIAMGGHIVQGNIIGANEAGDAAQPNETGIIVEAHATSGTVIGGTTATARNIISGNSEEGINMIVRNNLPPGTGLLIQGNYIGTDLTGLLPIGNGDGIRLFVSNHQVGGDADGAVNVISGNTEDGIQIVRTTAAVGQNSTIIQGNLIGLGVDGETAIPNESDGISMASGSNTNKILDNIISANGSRGISLSGSSNFPSAGNEIDGNIIGLNKQGTE